MSDPALGQYAVLTRGLSSDSTSTSTPDVVHGYTAIPTTSDPIVWLSPIEPNVIVMPYAAGSGNVIDLYLWALFAASDGTTQSYVSSFLLKITATCSTETGVADTAIDDSHYPVTSWAAPHASNTTNYRAQNGLNNSPGYIPAGVPDGAVALAAAGDITTGTSWNLLVGTYGG